MSKPDIKPNHIYTTAIHHRLLLRCTDIKPDRATFDIVNLINRFNRLTTSPGFSTYDNLYISRTVKPELIATPISASYWKHSSITEKRLQLLNLDVIIWSYDADFEFSHGMSGKVSDLGDPQLHDALTVTIPTCKYPNYPIDLCYRDVYIKTPSTRSTSSSKPDKDICPECKNDPNYEYNPIHEPGVLARSCYCKGNVILRRT